MYRNWKRAAALGLTVLLGCMMPMSTMLAAADDTEIEADDASGNDLQQEDKSIPDGADHTDGENGSDEDDASDEDDVLDEDDASDEENGSDEDDVLDEDDASDEESGLDEEGAPDDENGLDGENTTENESVGDVSDQGNDTGEIDRNSETVGDAGAADIGMAPPVMRKTQARGADEPESKSDTGAPEIVIKRGNENKAFSLGGEITFEYIGNTDTLFEVSVTGSDTDISIYCALDSVADTETKAKEEEQMGSLAWGKITSPYNGIKPINDGKYIVYVKVEKKLEGEKTQAYYARSCGVVWDTVKPVIKGVEGGKTYPEGTEFQVEDTNLDKVLVNGKEVSPENGKYKVAANGTSCEIKAIDKAKNESGFSISVSGTVTPETGSVISQNGEYALKAGEKYHLAEGSWKVDGDKSVYRGDSDFYVTTEGKYKFSK